MAEFTANDKWVNSELAKTLNSKLALTIVHTFGCPMLGYSTLKSLERGGYTFFARFQPPELGLASTAQTRKASAGRMQGLGLRLQAVCPNAGQPIAFVVLSCLGTYHVLGRCTVLNLKLYNGRCRDSARSNCRPEQPRNNYWRPNHMLPDENAGSIQQQAGASVRH